MYTAVAAAAVSASMKTGKPLQERYVLSIFTQEAPVCRCWEAIATCVQVAVVLLGLCVSPDAPWTFVHCTGGL